jgi:hypothetical protein
MAELVDAEAGQGGGVAGPLVGVGVLEGAGDPGPVDPGAVHHSELTVGLGQEFVQVGGGDAADVAPERRPEGRDRQLRLTAGERRKDGKTVGR